MKKSILIILMIHSMVVIAPAAQAETVSSWKDLNTRVAALYEAGLYEEALPIAKQSLKLAEAEFSQDSAEVSLALNNLALLHKLHGNYDQAIQNYKKALSIAEGIVGQDHQDLVVILNNLAFLYKAQGKQDQVNGIYERLRKISEPIEKFSMKSVSGKVLQASGKVLVLKKSSAEGNQTKEIRLTSLPRTEYKGFYSLDDLEIGSRVSVQVKWNVENEEWNIQTIQLLEKVMPAVTY